MAKVGRSSDLIADIHTGVPIRYSDGGRTPHHRAAHGSIEHFLVTVDVVEAMSSVDFFRQMEDATENWLEDQDTSEMWKRVFASED